MTQIKASALLHQFLRQRDDGGAIVADLDDYELARRLAKPLLEAALAGATTKTRDLIAESQELTREENPTSPESVTITSAKLYKRLSASGWSKTTVRRHLRAAEQAGYLDLVFQQRGREYEYRVVDGEVDTAIGLPTATELEPSAVEQAIRPDQTPDGAVKSSDVNDLAEVNQPDQGVGGEGFLFDPVPGPHSHDPDLE